MLLGLRSNVLYDNIWNTIFLLFFNASEMKCLAIIADVNVTCLQRKEEIVIFREIKDIVSPPQSKAYPLVQERKQAQSDLKNISVNDKWMSDALDCKVLKLKTLTCILDTVNVVEDQYIYIHKWHYRDEGHLWNRKNSANF